MYAVVADPGSFPGWPGGGREHGAQNWRRGVWGGGRERGEGLERPALVGGCSDDKCVYVNTYVYRGLFKIRILKNKVFKN